MSILNIPTLHKEGAFSQEELERLLSAEIPFFNDETIYSIRNIGTLPYYRTAQADMRAGKCPFCKLNETLNRVLYQNNFWRIWENPVKKKNNGVVHHLVAAPFNHVTTAKELTYLWASWGSVWEWLCSQYELDAGGGLISRLGPPSRNAGTIRHFHHNVMLTDGTKEFRAPLVKKPGDFVREDGPRLLVFEKLCRGVTTALLTEYELTLVKGRLE